MPVACALFLATGIPAGAGTVHTPIHVGVTITKPCVIAAPVSISLDASGKPNVARGTLAAGCGADPAVTVSIDASEENGYVVAISF